MYEWRKGYQRVNLVLIGRWSEEKMDEIYYYYYYYYYYDYHHLLYAGYLYSYS